MPWFSGGGELSIEREDLVDLGKNADIFMYNFAAAERLT